jgi:deoxycytidine triphosphate deaminase
MVLSAQTIKDQINKKNIKIEPFDESAVGGVTVDLRLGERGLNPDTGKEISLQEYRLSLDELVLANTKEQVTLPGNIMARVIARSSLARLGILLTFDADLLPPNYSGNPLLTMKNLSRRPVLLRSGLPICQILFEQVDKSVQGYKSRYNHNKPEPSKLDIGQ